MYKIERIAKLLKDAKNLEITYKKQGADKIHVCISKGNRKIGRVMNVSLMPVITCANCIECKFYCYDIKACIQYTNTVLPARMRNTVLARDNMKEYFHQIDEACTRRKKNKFFRWHVAGDILNTEYFENMVEIARKHPDFIFWTYTKNYKVVNEYCEKYGRSAIPFNLSIMFSEWDGMPLINPFNFPVFACKMKNGNKNRTEESFKGMHKCPGNCDICKENHRGCPYGESTYADEH